MAQPIPVAVVGAGYFGRFHAKQYAANPGARLVAVVDLDLDKAKAVAKEFGAETALTDVSELYGKVGAVSVASATAQHFNVGKALLQNGIHILVEKPITHSVETGQELTELAEAKGLTLQVGHIERFSAAFRTLQKQITRPLYIECYRIAPYKPRGTDVDVVHDVMIHDIDIIMGLVASKVRSVDAVGTPVITPSADVVNARILFESGCVATVTASRVSYKTERKLRVFQPNSYLSCDLAELKMFGYRLRGDPAILGPTAVEATTYDIPKEDSLANEIAEFLDCVATGRKPTVDGRAGCEALRVASLINSSIAEHRSLAEPLISGQ
ncbi:MAG: Gfo/Idh/MocA family protein [Hyphomicrobium sp.]